MKGLPCESTKFIKFPSGFIFKSNGYWNLDLDRFTTELSLKKTKKQTLQISTKLCLLRLIDLFISIRFQDAETE